MPNNSMDVRQKQRLFIMGLLFTRVVCCRFLPTSSQPFGAFLVKMKQSFLTIILLLLVFTFACTQNKKPDVAQPANVNENANLNYTQNKKPDIPESWKKIEECGLSFYAPSDLKEVEVQIIDSCATVYRNKNILVSLDLFENSGEQSDSRRNEYSDKKDFQIVETVVDGRKAEIITYYQNSSDFKERKDLTYGAVLFVPMVDESGDSLTIWTYCRSAEDRETTTRIFETIRFEK